MSILARKDQNSIHTALKQQTLTDAQLVLSRSPFLIFLPKELRAFFLVERQKQFTTIAKFGWPLLLCMLIGEMTIAHVFYSRNLQGHDHIIWDNHFFFVQLFYLRVSCLHIFLNWHQVFSFGWDC
jgi:hypothetical protein